MNHGDSMRDDSGSNHGCWPARPVAWAIRVAIATLCLPVHGCDTVNGGAVELSWKLRPASSSLDKKFVDCNSEQPLAGPVTGIRLHWRVDEQDCGVDGSKCSEVWLCGYNHGVTGFDLPEGTADLWVTPECATGPASANTYIAPALVQRRVIRGDTVSLGAVELVVSVSYCATQPCICQ